jgi:aspartate/methionine/tyrosine aminotransferase
LRLAPFKLETYFERYEFSVPYLLSSSDAETIGMDELLALADDDLAAAWRSLKLGYTEVRGHPLLRAEIASLYDDVDPDDVIVWSGAQEPIFAVMNVLARDHVIAVTPTYQSLYEVARGQGAVVDTVSLDESAGWALDVDAVRALVRPETSLIVLNLPNQPTGSLIAEAQLRELAELGPRLFVDEVYRWMEHDPDDLLPAAVELGGISVGVISKAFGLPGLRIGWTATRDAALRDRLVSVKHYLTICAAAPSEILAAIALRAREQVLARTRAIAADGLARIDDLMARRPHDIRWVRPRAGTIGFAELPRVGDVDAFCARLADQQGVMLLPGSVFDWPGNHVRLGYARAGLDEALARLERAL